MNLITPEAFEKVRAMLEDTRKKTRPRIHNLYDVVCAIFYKEAHGLSWRQLPNVFPPWRTVHEYHLQWSRELQMDGTSTLDKLKATLMEESHG